MNSPIQKRLISKLENCNKILKRNTLQTEGLQRLIHDIENKLINTSKSIAQEIYMEILHELVDDLIRTETANETLDELVDNVELLSVEIPNLISIKIEKDE